jgi:hypothetical protein
VPVSLHAPAKFIADIAPVHEVALHGTADLSYWKEQLKPFGLLPKLTGGRAHVVISAMRSKFRGLPFCEICIGITAQLPPCGENRLEAPFLMQAFNSSRLFTFCERFFFSTPYRHGKISVDVDDSAFFMVCDRENLLARGRIAAGERNGSVEARTHDENWEGPIFLPNVPKPGAGPQFFRARISGKTTVWPFDASLDEFEMPAAERDKGTNKRSDAPASVFAQLRDSGFAATEWHLRPNANHARSKTFAAIPAEVTI